MVYNDNSSHSLTCISRGSPATTVIWRRNGVVIGDLRYKKTQIITLTRQLYYYRLDYQNQFIGDFNIAGITCQVSNTVGSSQIYPITGEPYIMV